MYNGYNFASGNFGGFGGQMMQPLGQFPGLGGPKMQPLGMGQMPTGGTRSPMLGEAFMASPQAQSLIQNNPAAQHWFGAHPGFDPAQFSYGMGMGLLGQNMSPGFRPFANSLGQFGMQRMMNRGAPVG